MYSKVVNLKSILTYQGLSSGYSFRGKIKHVHNGGVRVIQLKDFNDNYTSIGNDCYLIDSDTVKSKYYLKTGDILFTSKGTNNFALVFESIDDIPTIASSALFVVKVDETLANPNFVAWYINQSKVQNYFKSNEAGTYTKSISKSILEEVPIALPSLDLQTKIATIASLYNREQTLSNQIVALQHKLITTQLLNAI
ncbi:MAG: hypothetical protein CMC13_15745 [Flavobacteriaceae bacterium]|nr:hypothetical protein [Flavobacteriaceae bacterium]|tara:strand:- start:1753 stop:2340 length:588 start_codon:yes stop_codon:yes gene_type:complete